MIISKFKRELNGDISEILLNTGEKLQNVEYLTDLEEKTVTENGTYTPSTGKVGFSKVVVNVSGGSGGNVLYAYGGIFSTDTGGNDCVTDWVCYSNRILTDDDLESQIKVLSIYYDKEINCNRMDLMYYRFDETENKYYLTLDEVETEHTYKLYRNSECDMNFS